MECINYGNETISQNKWTEQFPSYKGERLVKLHGYPLARFSLKNRTNISISVKSINILTPEMINSELDKFNY